MGLDRTQTDLLKWFREENGGERGGKRGYAWRVMEVEEKKRMGKGKRHFSMNVIKMGGGDTVEREGAEE